MPPERSAGQPQQRLALRNRFLACVQEISQQTEVQVLVSIRQKPNFKRFDEMIDVFRADEHRRDHGQSAEFRRDPFGKVYAGQRKYH